MARTHRGVLINRHRSAVRAAVDASWAGTETDPEARRELHKKKRLLQKRFESYAVKTEEDIEKLLDVLINIKEELLMTTPADNSVAGTISHITFARIVQTIGSIEP